MKPDELMTLASMSDIDEEKTMKETPVPLGAMASIVPPCYSNALLIGGVA